MRKHRERRKNGKKRITREARGARTRPDETHQRARERRQHNAHAETIKQSQNKRSEKQEERKNNQAK